MEPRQRAKLSVTAIPGEWVQAAKQLLMKPGLECASATKTLRSSAAVEVRALLIHTSDGSLNSEVRYS